MLYKHLALVTPLNRGNIIRLLDYISLRCIFFCVLLTVSIYFSIMHIWCCAELHAYIEHCSNLFDILFLQTVVFNLFKIFSMSTEALKLARTYYGFVCWLMFSFFFVWKKVAYRRNGMHVLEIKCVPIYGFWFEKEVAHERWLGGQGESYQEKSLNYQDSICHSQQIYISIHYSLPHCHSEETE